MYLHTLEIDIRCNNVFFNQVLMYFQFIYKNNSLILM